MSSTLSRPIWKRPLVICFTIGLVAGIAIEVLYQRSGYCKRKIYEINSA
jgi:hypothetical protein